MLAILVTHPIQYHVPLWQMLAKDRRVPFEVWYLSEHATRVSRDREFGQEFAWDLDMLKGYPHRFLKTPQGATPNTFWRCRVAESLPKLFRETQTKVLWVQGWQVAAYWQGIWAAHKAGVQVWLRGESNALREQGARSEEQGAKSREQASGSDEPTARRGAAEHATRVPPQWGIGKRLAKRIVLGQLFRHVDHFLCIGTANRELYRSYGVPESKLHMAPYAVDNDRFAKQAETIRGQRSVVRSQWSIPEESFCVLFCGKFIPKKRPMDLVKAAQLLITDNRMRNVHLLFAGSGELGGVLRAECDVVFDSEQSAKGAEQSAGSAGDPPLSSMPLAPRTDNREPRKPSGPSDGRPITDNAKPRASFAGFLNQTEVSSAYVAGDVLVLPSDYDETWGLVVNEAMASGLPCIISDRCGCAPDLGGYSGNSVFEYENVEQLARHIADHASNRPIASQPPSLDRTVEVVASIYMDSSVAGGSRVV